MTDEPIRSLAGRLMGHDDPEVRRLAAYVLGDADDKRASDLADDEIQIPGGVE